MRRAASAQPETQPSPPVDVPWGEFDVLFLGGTTEWKLGTHARQLVTEAKRRGKHVHMGRVNSERRLQHAAAIGCDSADGTFLTFGPRRNLPQLLGWVLRLSSQPPLPHHEAHDSA